MVNKKQVGIGALAAAAAAAGYYFYASKDAPKHRKIATRWASDLKRETLREVKKLKQIERADVMQAIESAAKAYQSARSVDPKEFMRAARELKNNWQSVAKEAVGARRPASRKRAAPRKNVAKTARKRARRG